MTREARAIRDSIPDLAQGVLRSKNRAAIVCIVMGSGWEPMPEVSFASRLEAARMYRQAVTLLAGYLEQNGELYDDLIVA